MIGRSSGNLPTPSTTCRSLWQTPVATVRTRTSRPHGLSISIASIVNGSCTFRKTAAFVSMSASLQELLIHGRARRSIIPAGHEEGGMTAIEPSGQILGATVRGADLAKPLSDADFAALLLALGRHGVLRFPDQRLEAVELRDFSRRFGRIQATLTGRHHEPGMPEVGFLSNIIENGEPIGITDAGQDWHTDMSYNETIGFLNVLYAVTVPRRNGQVLGATAFVNTQAAHDDLTPDVRTRLEGATATHDFNKFWENMRRRPGSLHNAIADYRPDEHRLMKRCQVMADRIFDPAFVREALSAVSAPAGAMAG